ncbi:MAG: nuclear transport factor 2 family protein [Halioglobus sp.]|nr:nuclear transport factor 2 family protein [Halioglobus sp.]
MQADELAARESLRDLTSRYNMHGDSGRIAELVALFTEDGELEVDGDAVCRGHTALHAFFAGVAQGGASVPELRTLRHHLTTQQIDMLDAGRATARTYFTVYTDRGVDHWGVYRDDFRLTAQGWRIARRRVGVDGFTPGGWGEAAMAANTAGALRDQKS